ncbi:MAG: phosphoglucosamine mutase [Candidatus Omnitrophica bacterium]|nr:phosphoglucosamine mutase [Candidatus Omnitrophota bacterium]
MSDGLPKKDKLFGTDGIRGTPGVYPLSDGMIFKIGTGVAKLVAYQRKNGHKPKVIIGRDTRTTGERMEGILANAITYQNIDVLSAGIITTPGLSYLVRKLGADMGIVISASHNRPKDNGIKFFNRKGHKLSTEEEEWIEDIIYNNLLQGPQGNVVPNQGKMIQLDQVFVEYIHFLLSTAEGYDLAGYKAVVDCAWGAACPFAHKLFDDLGVEADTIHDEPNGEHINTGGSLNPEILQQRVKEQRADIGIAFDGDGDRAVFVDETGELLQGDDILAILALWMVKKGKLAGNAVAVSCMTNLGVTQLLEKKGAQVITTPVGDKYVLAEMLKRKLNLGGEPSGHILFLDYLPTSDGMLTALQVLKVMSETGAKLSQLKKCFIRVPQVLVNVEVRERKPFTEMEVLQEKIAYFERQLEGEGRIFLRYSGTEKVARVMVEGNDKVITAAIAESLANEIKKEVGVEFSARDEK